MAMLSTGAFKTLSNLGGLGDGATRAGRQAAQSRSSDRVPEEAMAERAAKSERSRSVRETPDLFGAFDQRMARQGNSAPLLPSAGPLALGGNSLLGL